MFKGATKAIKACYGGKHTSKGDENKPPSGVSRDDPLLWSCNLEKHYLGEFSYAVVQTNEVNEDHSQVEVFKEATYVGIYDGHNGHEAAEYLFDTLLDNLTEDTIISANTIVSAILKSEKGYRNLVASMLSKGQRPTAAHAGSSCLLGLVYKGKLYIANLGDSRAVLGFSGSDSMMYAEELTWEHTASKAEERNELRMNHPKDPNILVLKEGMWLIKGVIQVSRSIGDLYLKDPYFALDVDSKFYLKEHICRPVLTTEPSIILRFLRRGDKFLIFASAGLWDYLTSEEAVKIVNGSPREGIARRLIETAMKKAATEKGIRYEDLMNVQKGKRREYHDEITVVVIFLDHNLLDEALTKPVTTGSYTFSTLHSMRVNREKT